MRMAYPICSTNTSAALPITHENVGDTACIKDMLGSISQQIGNLASEINAVKLEVKDINSNVGVFYELEQQQELMEKTVRRHNEYADQVDLLTCVTSQQEKQIEGLRQCIEKMEVNSLKNNIIITGIEQTEEEDCVDKVNDFIAVKLEAPDDVSIVNAFRIGEGKNRALKVMLKSLKDKTYIFQHRKNLKGKKNSLEQSYFVQNDLLE